MELAIIATLSAAIISLVVYLILNKKKNENDVNLIRREAVNEDRGPNEVMSFTNPYSKMRFDESLNSGFFMNRLQESQMDDVNHAIAKMLGLSYNPESGVRIAESIKAYENMSRVVWNLSKDGRKLLKSKQAEYVVQKGTGKLLPTIRDAQGKKYLEHFKGVPPTKLAKLTNVALIVVNTAHIISGADLAKKMDQANKKLDALIAYRKIDRYSELEEIFYELGEVKWESLNKEEIKKLNDLHRRIRLIRITARNEVESELTRIMDFRRKKTFINQFRSQSKNDALIHDEVVKLRDKMKLLEYTFNIEIPVLQVLEINEEIIKSELKLFEKLIDQLDALNSKIRSKASGNGIDIEIEYMESMKKKYELFSIRNQHSLDPTLEIQVAG